MRRLVGLLCLLGQKHCLDVGQHTSLSDGDAGQQLVQLLVVADGELQVTGDDPRLLVVAGCVTCQLENLGSQVLHNCSQINRRSGTDSLSIVALAQMAMNTTNGELETSTRRASLALSLRFSTFATSRHDDSCVLEKQDNNAAAPTEPTCYSSAACRANRAGKQPAKTAPTRNNHVTLTTILIHGASYKSSAADVPDKSSRFLLRLRTAYTSIP